MPSLNEFAGFYTELEQGFGCGWLGDTPVSYLKELPKNLAHYAGGVIMLISDDLSGFKRKSVERKNPWESPKQFTPLKSLPGIKSSYRKRVDGRFSYRRYRKVVNGSLVDLVWVIEIEPLAEVVGLDGDEAVDMEVVFTSS